MHIIEGFTFHPLEDVGEIHYVFIRILQIESRKGNEWYVTLVSSRPQELALYNIPQLYHPIREIMNDQRFPPLCLRIRETADCEKVAVRRHSD